MVEASGLVLWGLTSGLPGIRARVLWARVLTHVRDLCLQLSLVWMPRVSWRPSGGLSCILTARLHLGFSFTTLSKKRFLGPLWGERCSGAPEARWAQLRPPRLDARPAASAAPGSSPRVCAAPATEASRLEAASRPRDGRWATRTAPATRLLVPRQDLNSPRPCPRCVCDHALLAL